MTICSEFLFTTQLLLFMANHTEIGGVSIAVYEIEETFVPDNSHK